MKSQDNERTAYLTTIPRFLKNVSCPGPYLSPDDSPHCAGPMGSVVPSRGGLQVLRLLGIPPQMTLNWSQGLPGPPCPQVCFPKDQPCCRGVSLSPRVAKWQCVGVHNTSPVEVSTHAHKDLRRDRGCGLGRGLTAHSTVTFLVHGCH